MTDPSPPPRPDDDTRDPRVAAWLSVEPLDEVTRARLVRTALAGSDAADRARPADDRAVGSGSRRRWVAGLAGAAAVLIALAVALAVVPGGDDTTTTASDAPTLDSGEASRRVGDDGGATSAAPEELPTASDAGDSGDATETLGSVTVPSVGDLGDVSTEAALAEAARPLLRSPFTGEAVTVTGCALDAARAFGTPVATGTGTLDGGTATVVLVERPAGTTVVVAVRGRSCGRAVSAVVP